MIVENFTRDELSLLLGWVEYSQGKVTDEETLAALNKLHGHLERVYSLSGRGPQTTSDGLDRLGGNLLPTVLCETCEGTGRDPKSELTHLTPLGGRCPDCGGTGEVPGPEDTVLQEAIEIMRQHYKARPGAVEKSKVIIDSTTDDKAAHIKSIRESIAENAEKNPGPQAPWVGAPGPQHSWANKFIDATSGDRPARRGGYERREYHEAPDSDEKARWFWIPQANGKSLKLHDIRDYYRRQEDRV